MPSFDESALAQTLASVDPTATIRPPSLQDTVAHDAASGAIAETLDPLGQRLQLGGTIGQGGMAIVRKATQTSLHREVAVKTLRVDAANEAAPRLLREAWITGALEHPNIVPVHDLGTDESGRPLIVLKRIEGEPWKPSARELEENLATLMQVCHAIAFAHSRGIVHRDLKPDNVMIGAFGEVYVLDWGIAVSVRDDGSGRLPLAADAREVAGTLAYMAPEMLGHGVPSERTDVFLLGAVLYEIVEGKPPHLLESVSASLESIRTCVPSFAESAEGELVAICRRAMAKDPAERYASADELRTAISEFLEHRTSAQIARESHDRLRELEAQLATPDATRVTMYQLFGQCRFGFQAALRTWPENAAAREGLDRALATMATHELAHGDARAAAVLIAELSTPNAALSERLAVVEREAAEKRKRLERFEIDQDMGAGQLTRTVFMTFLGILWSAIPIVVDVFALVKIDHPTSFAIPLVMLTLVVGFGVWARDSMTKSAINRGILVTVIVGCLLHATTEAIGWATDLPLPQTHMMSLSMWVGAGGIASVYMDRSLFVPTLAFIGALVVTVVAPPQRFIAMSVATFTMFGIAMYATFSQRRGRKVYGFAELLRRRER